MSLAKLKKMGSSHDNRERLLREELMVKYSAVNGEYERTEDGFNIVTEGENWLNGLEGHVKQNVAILFENQMKVLTENTNTDSSGSFEVVSFPMVRRIFSKLLANDIVSIQAMTQPSGVLFYFQPKISDRVETTGGTQGHTITANYANCVGSNCPNTTFSSCKSLYDRFYSDDLYDFSKGAYTIVTATGAPVAFDDDGCTVTSASLALAQDGSVRQAMFGVSGFQGVPGGGTARLLGGKGLEIDTEAFLASLTVVNVGADIQDEFGNVIYATGDEVHYRLPAQKYGRSIVEYDFRDLCDAAGTLLIELDFTHPAKACDQCPTYDGYIGAESGLTIANDQFAFAWRRYDDLEYETEMGEVSFDLEKVQVSAEPRKLRAKWSPELAQDVAAYHNLDAEAELTALLSEVIGMEIDREILRDLKRGAAWKTRWDYYGWKQQGTQKYTQKEWNQTLITKINQISAQIHKTTLRGGANFIVVSAEVSAIFDDLDAFMVSTAAPADDRYNLGIRRIGTVSGRYTVYVDPYSRPNDVLVGHKGTSLLDTGYIFAPYIALALSPVLTDPTNFTNVRGVMTRYAKKLVNNRYYGLVFVDNVFTFNTRELR